MVDTARAKAVVQVQVRGLDATRCTTRGQEMSRGVICIPAPGAPDRNALSAVAGTFRDDPLWDDMMAAISERRRQMDAEDEFAG